MLYAFVLLVGLAVGALVVAGLVHRPAARRWAETERGLRAEAETRSAELIALNRDAAESSAQRQALEKELAELKAERERERARRADEIAALEQQQRLAFKNLANEILDEKSRQFKQSNRESLESLLNPFREQIEGFRKRVDEVYKGEIEQHSLLKNEICRLSEANLRISEEADNLTRALKGNSKVQGDWGEMLLETILDSSHLTKGIHYETQHNLKDEQGNNLRPDVILKLPEGKRIVIDSKVSLTAYVAYTESATPEDASRAVKDHLRSVRAHVDELSGKCYQTLLDRTRSESPDFVIMFVPSEPAFLLAMQQDASLWGYAYNKKVIVSSPTNLFALLKIVDDLWKRDMQSRNARKIADEGGKLYDKFMGFTETLVDLGKSISASSERYERAIKQLKTGRGNLIRRTEQLRELGVKATKSLPNQLSDYDEEDERTEIETVTENEDKNGEESASVPNVR
ncbi:MAG TPA: DNA recombination protein RmuC [Alistipes ihumii]|uniref:DNA recombination protein RmuC n=1 Tax=Alistipes TaxID=239759 RepID=UPI001DC82761|nr:MULTISPECIES: DNA recombination protein RmuC [Alistipes]MBS1365192.1 DNA recombination protein RmuC [Alistipes sp.]HJG74741.1 DNA recombination protein RmuC [Alistipes ihumii]